MNSSIGQNQGLNIMNTTLRIAMFCQAYNLWLEQDPSGVGFAWHGHPVWDFVNIKSRLGLEYEVITELPEPEANISSDKMALLRNMADISIDLWGVSYEGSKDIDFSYTDYFVPVYIFSGKPYPAMHSNLVMGVFDDISYGLLALALVLIGLVSQLIVAREERRSSLITSMLYVVGNAFKQPPHPLLIPKRWLGQIIMTLFGLYNHVICLMYGSIIISFLISGSKPPEINLLGDLNIDENLNKRIIINKGSYIIEFLKEAKMLDGFEHRIDAVEYTDMFKPQTLNKILQGSHVMMDQTAGLFRLLCRMKKAHYTQANQEYFRKSR